MSIKKIDPTTATPEDTITLKFDNGDFAALETIKKKWKFKDEESLLKFALAVLVKAEQNTVSIKNESGQDTSLKPSENLLLKDS